MVISCASGKGGTGKTTVATTLALSLGHNVQLLDCDVEEPNAHVFIKPDITDSQEVTIAVPKIDNAICNYCGECARICAYHALAVVKNAVVTFSNLCHGCGGCSLLCPEKAISETGKIIGIVERGKAGDIDFVHGKLNIGEVLSPPVIRAVKKHIAEQKVTIIDAPPGTACPVIAAIKNSDFCILVTEPTPFGLHDLKLAVEVVQQLQIPCGVVINRAGIGDGHVAAYCSDAEIPVLLRIPFDRDIAVAYSRGIGLVDTKEEYRAMFKQMYEWIKGRHYAH